MFKLIGVALLSSLLSVCAHAELSYRIYPLGDLNAGGQTSANALNNHGSVAGVTPIGGKPAAVVWNEGIATQIPLGPDQTEFANGINDVGTVVGMMVQNDLSQHAFAWNGKSVTILPGLDAQANAINDAGEIAGYITANGAQEATVWNGGKATVLDIPGAIQSSASVITNHGDVIGEYSDGAATHTFLDQNGKIKELATANRSLDQAFAVNGKDQVVGSSNGPNRPDAGVFQSGNIKQLSPVPEYLNDRAFGINDDGVVVGQSEYTDSEPSLPDQATVWNDGIPTNLNSLLPANSGWRLRVADSINDRGQIIGVGTFKHQAESFIMTPSSQAIPLPSPLLLGLSTFPVAILAAGAQRRHMKRAA